MNIGEKFNLLTKRVTNSHKEVALATTTVMATKTAKSNNFRQGHTMLDSFCASSKTIL